MFSCFPLAHRLCSFDPVIRFLSLKSPLWAPHPTRRIKGTATFRHRYPRCDVPGIARGPPTPTVLREVDYAGRLMTRGWRENDVSPTVLQPVPNQSPRWICQLRGCYRTGLSHHHSKVVYTCSWLRRPMSPSKHGGAPAQNHICSMSL